MNDTRARKKYKIQEAGLLLESAACCKSYVRGRPVRRECTFPKEKTYTGCAHTPRTEAPAHLGLETRSVIQHARTTPWRIGAPLPARARARQTGKRVH